MSAYTALVSLMQLLQDIEHHPSPPITLDKNLIDSISQCITFFQEFLHDYNSPLGDDEEAADPLVMRIAYTSHIAEIVIQSHITDSIQQRRSSNGGFNINRLFIYFRPSKEANDGNDEKIKSINLCHDLLQGVIEEMDSIKREVVVKADTEKRKKKKKMALVVHDQVVMKNIPASNGSMVGPNDNLIEITEKLTGGRLDFQVISIVGMGGIGKTFLAKNIYARQNIKDRFDKSAWVTISQQYDMGEILCEVLSQATNKEKHQLSGKCVDELGLELYQYLFHRRFLIVMDDMWNIDLWDKIQHFLPNQSNGSRVLVTTRLSQLSSQLNNDYFHRMCFLDEARSWDLFSKTVFGEKSCPQELKKIGEKIVGNCRGLPLSIVVVGGLLKKMDNSLGYWESIQDNVSSVVNLDNDKHCLRLLMMSYNHLPVYLKPCFLYMGLFKDDKEVRVSELVKQWVSTGILKPRNGEALEITGRGILQDLIDRNLILPGRLGATGSIKHCKIHDLLRDLCLEEGQKDGFYYFIGQHNPSNGMDVSYLNTTGPRHFNYQHLTIRTIGNSSCLSSLSLFWNLQTLIFSGLCKHTFLVRHFWKMTHLRHIEFVRDLLLLPDPPRDGQNGIAVGIMENLQTIKGVRNFKCLEDVVKRIPNIRKLKIRYSGLNRKLKDEYIVVRNIKYLCRLESLSIARYSTLRENAACMHNLSFPHSLKKLTLCLWIDNMLEKIGLLPLLEKLKLSCWGFSKGEWEVVEGQFPSLKYLELKKCTGLKNWTAAVERSNILPRLEHLYIESLLDLEKIPCELGNVLTLKKIVLFNCAAKAVMSVWEMVDEQLELQGGEELMTFQVEVNLWGNNEYLMRLAGPNFVVKS